MIHLFPDGPHLIAIAASSLVALGCVGLGFLFGARRPSTALIAGWGVAAFVTVVLGALARTPLNFLVIGLAGLGIVGLIRANFLGFDRGAVIAEGRLFLLALPLILLVGAMSPSQYDEFSHWLPNLSYIVVHDHFPTLAVPNAESTWPAYPYGLPLVGFAASLLTGHLAETTGIVWNVFMMIAVGCTVMRVLELRLAQNGSSNLGGNPPGWALAALCFLLGGLALPSFVPKIAFTNYGDNSAAAIVAIALGAVLEATSAVRADRGRNMAVAGWCGAALVNIRQDSLVLFLLLVCGIVLTLARYMRDSDLRWRDFLWLVPAPVLTSAAWRHYAASEIPAGAPILLPPAQWHWAQLPDTLQSMGHVILNKGGMFALLIGVSIAAALAIGFPRRFTMLQRLAVITGATVALGNIAFLLFAYLAASFGIEEVRTATSFWRYVTHGGDILAVATIALIPAAWFSSRHFLRWGTISLPALALCLPPATAKFLRFDLRTHTTYLRMAGHNIAEHSRAASRILLIDQEGDGSNLNEVRYQLLVADQIGSRASHPRIAEASNVSDPAKIAGLHEADLIWIYEGTSSLRAITSLPLQPHHSYLLARDADGYRIVDEQEFPAAWSSSKD